MTMTSRFGTAVLFGPSHLSPAPVLCASAVLHFRHLLQYNVEKSPPLGACPGAEKKCVHTANHSGGTRQSNDRVTVQTYRFTRVGDSAVDGVAEATHPSFLWKTLMHLFFTVRCGHQDVCVEKAVILLPLTVGTPDFEVPHVDKTLVTLSSVGRHW